MTLRFLDEFAGCRVEPDISLVDGGGVAVFTVDGRTRWTIEFVVVDSRLTQLTLIDVASGVRVHVPHPERVTGEPFLGRCVENLRRDCGLTGVL